VLLVFLLQAKLVLAELPVCTSRAENRNLGGPEFLVGPRMRQAAAPGEGGYPYATSNRERPPPAPNAHKQQRLSDATDRGPLKAHS
jgi:hypothetical protein